MPTHHDTKSPAETRGITVGMWVTFAGNGGTVAEVRGAYAFVVWDERPSSWHSIFELAVVR